MDRQSAQEPARTEPLANGTGSFGGTHGLILNSTGFLVTWPKSGFLLRSRQQLEMSVRGLRKFVSGFLLSVEFRCSTVDDSFCIPHCRDG